jgi:hypothetical protein
LCVGRDRVTLEEAEQPGSREAERARARESEPDADPLNLNRVMPAEGERKNLITTDQWYLGRATVTPLYFRLLAWIMARGDQKLHHHASGAVRDISRGP